MAEMLTAQQKEAVYNRGGKLLVSAAAGSGKTKVLVDRLLSYITDAADPANIDDFLIITYTKAAASELRGKIAAKLTQCVAQDPGNRHLQQQLQRLYLTKISTVHAFCTDFLREFSYLMDLPGDFRVADENESIEIQLQTIDYILEQAYQNTELDEDFYCFINSQGFGRDDRQIPEILLKVYNSAQCHLNPDEWLDWCIASADVNGMKDCSETVWGSYILEDFKSYLRLQINAMKRCADAAAAAFEMEKPAQLLKATVLQLEFLAESKTWEEVIARKDIDFGRLTFSKKCTDLELAERIKAVRDACKKGLERKLRSFASNSEQVFQDLQSSAASARGLIRLVRTFTKEYEKRKKIRRVLDFGDLEHKTLDLLMGKKRTGPTALAAETGKRYREIMVDEYQDSNGVQDAIFAALTHKKQNCFMVGDVKQSIYQFRLADPGIFLQKYNSYADAVDAKLMEGRKVLLSSNFRSSEGIIQCVNDVFSYCMSTDVGGLSYDEPEQLREGVPHISINEPEASVFIVDVKEDTYAEEASVVAKKICSLLDGTHMVRQGDSLRPIRPEDIVILLRSPGSVGAEFTYALERHGICCTMGNSVDLLQTEEVSLLRSLLQIISNPLQDIPLIAVLVSRIFGFTADDLARIRSKNRWCSMYEALTAHKDEKTSGFIELLSELRMDARMYNLPQLLQRIFIRTSMDSIFAAMDDGVKKKENLHIFCQIASDFEAAGRRDLNQFLEYLDAMEEKGLSFASELQNQGSVTIMSIHKSKGLEFPVVFLCGLSRSFNQESAHAQVLCDKELGIGLSCVDTHNRVRYPTVAKRAVALKVMKDSISEELRVLYVAMTRARDRLVMTYAAKNVAGDLSDIALRLDMSGRQLMTSHVSCPGDWVLQTAMQRTEAGQLFKMGGHPDCVKYTEPMWDIYVTQADEDVVAAVDTKIESNTLPQTLIDTLRASLSFKYPWELATQMPSKQTATQLKGRFKDQEAAEMTQEVPYVSRKFRKPSFVESSIDGRVKGNAVHAVMQHISFDACLDLESTTAEIQRLVNDRRISPEQGQLIDPLKIATLFSTEIGRKLRESKHVLREFKFSILDNSSRYSPGLDGEEVLLQGVVDCALIEPDGITVVDFKTDTVTEETLQTIIDRYKTQVHIYADALSRIYKQPVKAKYLYLFGLDRFVSV